MNRLLLVFGLLVAGVVGLGFYLGWFQFATNSLDGKGHIELTVDKDKFHADEKKAMDKVHDLGRKDKAANGGNE